MTSLVLDGWRPGLKKVALTKLLHSGANVPLDTAKHHVDDLLAGRGVIISMASLEEAQSFALAADALGAIARVGTAPIRR